ncbi:MAG: methyl-accepting chemotaxis protein [Treponema sp.]|nr:methyl-accepting chemotaxis protein [Treponema sp.]
MHSLKIRITLAALCILLLSNFVIGFFTTSKSKKSLELQMEKSISESVHSTAEAIYASNEKEYKMLETLSALPQIRDVNISLLDKTHTIYGAMSLDKDYLDVCILDEKGFAWINNGEKMIPFSERDYYQVPYKTGERYVTDPFINKVTNAMAVFYAVPVFDYNNNISNVLFCVIDGFKVSDLATDHKAGNNRPASLISLSSGLVIASENHDAVAMENFFDTTGKKISPEYTNCLNKIKKGESGISKYSLNGKKYICSYEKIKNTDWMAIEIVPFADFQTDINRMTNSIILYSVIFTILSLLIITYVVSHSIKPLDNLKKAILDIATGNADLTKRIDSSSKDEIGEVVKGFNQFQKKLQDIISDIKYSKEKLNAVGEQMSDSANETTESIFSVYQNIERIKDQIVTQSNSVQLTSSAVTEISSNIESLEKMIISQTNGVSQASASVEQLIANICAVNNSIEQMADSFENLISHSDIGLEKQKIVSKKIAVIEQQSKDLQNANQVISKIASKTNLLAMNAAIEAAHAGDAGKGFSVVADEIKKLSETSSRESNKITQQLEEIIQSVVEVVDATNQSTASLKEMYGHITATSAIVKDIRSSMEEQTSGSQQICDTLHIINDNTEEVRQASHEMTMGNQSILVEIEKLQTATSTMKETMNEITKGADFINKSGTEMRTIAPEMQASIDKISSQINQFRV